MGDLWFRALLALQLLTWSLPAAGLEAGAAARCLGLPGSLGLSTRVRSMHWHPAAAQGGPACLHRKSSEAEARCSSAWFMGGRVPAIHPLFSVLEPNRHHWPWGPWHPLQDLSALVLELRCDPVEDEGGQG